MGKKKQPFYRIVAMDVRASRQGQTLAQVGTYDPLHAKVRVDEEAARQWLDRGAQMTDTVEALFRSHGVLARWQGLEGKVREDALTRDKPARRRKLASQAAQTAESEEPAESAETEAPAPEPEAEEPETAAPEAEETETQE